VVLGRGWWGLLGRSIRDVGGPTSFNEKSRTKLSRRNWFGEEPAPMAWAPGQGTLLTKARFCSHSLSMLQVSLFLTPTSYPPLLQTFLPRTIQRFVASFPFAVVSPASLILLPSFRSARTVRRGSYFLKPSSLPLFQGGFGQCRFVLYHFTLHFLHVLVRKWVSFRLLIPTYFSGF
jgi:hypothetical protein